MGTDGEGASAAVRLATADGPDLTSLDIDGDDGYVGTNNKIARNSAREPFRRARFCVAR
jgi:hypothetical protein